MYRNLEVWKKAYERGLLIYRYTDCFPAKETYGMTSQIRRSATSIAVNIAEGYSRKSDNELRRFLLIARGSASETETWLMFAKDLGYIENKKAEEIFSLINEVKALIYGFLKSLE